MKAFERFKEIDALPSVQEKHRAWLRDYEGLVYSIAEDGAHKIKWATEKRKYADKDFNSQINCIGRLTNRTIIEFDGDEIKAKEHLEQTQKKLKDLGIGHIKSTHQGKSPYLWVEFTRSLTDNEVESFLKWIAPEESQVDLNFKSSNKVFAVLYAPHWKHPYREMPIDFFEGKKINFDALNIPQKISGQSKTVDKDGFKYKTFVKGSRLVFKSGLDSWEDCKKEIIESENKKFYCHNKDSIKGKPQAITSTTQDLTLSSTIEIIDDKGVKSKEYRFFTERLDKRYLRGEIVDSIVEEFFVYSVIDNKKKYIVLSRQELEPVEFTFKGMALKISSATEINSTLRLSGFAKIFIVESAEPSLKVLSAIDLVKRTKESGMKTENFIDYIHTHPSKGVLKFPPLNAKLQAIQIVSGKYEGYPLHILKLGLAGTGKTLELECLDNRFKEEAGIFECANATPKGLIPSFQTKPASPGYCLRVNRLGLLDEMFKMIEKGMDGGTRQADATKNALGSLNMILEHKERSIGAGNGDNFKVKATAKYLITTNPFTNFKNLAQHVGIIDSTTLSRVLPVVHDKDYMDFVAKQKSGVTISRGNEKSGVTDLRPKTKEEIDYNIYNIPLNSKQQHTTQFIDDNFSLEIQDSCQIFLVPFDISRVQSIFNGLLSQIKHYTLRDMWKARGLHHMVLILDGIVKLRCLFEDYDPNFMVIEKDYEELERIVLGVIKSWEFEFNSGYDGSGKL